MLFQEQKFKKEIQKRNKLKQERPSVKVCLAYTIWGMTGNGDLATGWGVGSGNIRINSRFEIWN